MYIARASDATHPDTSVDVDENLSSRHDLANARLQVVGGAVDVADVLLETSAVLVVNLEERIDVLTKALQVCEYDLTRKMRLGRLTL